MKNDPAVRNFDGTQGALYPHLKIANESYPRVLATRKIENDGAEYFGAFLTKTSARILIDFINRVFRLRSCDIPVDGKFPVPCTQYYHRRCLAPCVKSLCSKRSYLEMVDMVRLFLANNRDELRAELQQKIANSSVDLNFEAAAYWRDVLAAVEDHWSKPRWNVWLDNNVVDTYSIDQDRGGMTAFLVTQRGRYVLGRKVFRFDRSIDINAAFQRIVHGFYQAYAPREIRVSQDLTARKDLSAYLSKKFGRDVPITIVPKNRSRVTTARAVRQMLDESTVDAAKPTATPAEISAELSKIFGLAKPPREIEAFDVAHISGGQFVAASSVWIEGRFVGSKYRFEIADRTSELDCLANAVARRLKPKTDRPDLVLVDGGRAQLAAVTRSVSVLADPGTYVVAAAKPQGKHSGISYFLLPSGKRIEFDESSPAQNMLKLLRDDAHDLANRVHRDLRDMPHNYQLAGLLPSLSEGRRRELLKKFGSASRILASSEAELSEIFDRQTTRKVVADLRNARAGLSREVLPLIVPIRFVDDNGSADDLRPITTR